MLYIRIRVVRIGVGMGNLRRVISTVTSEYMKILVEFIALFLHVFIIVWEVTIVPILDAIICVVSSSSMSVVCRD